MSRPDTRISIRGTSWFLNGHVTYPGTIAQGLLMNVRMVNAIFEDRNQPRFDADANTARFLGAISDYVDHGVRAITICLQGGMPGYEDAINTAFETDGELRASYLSRAERVIRACDQRGACVILGCHYQRQSRRLRDDAAVLHGVRNVARWIRQQGFTNVLLEVANEFGHPGYAHETLKTADGVVRLIHAAREEAPGLLISASRQSHRGIASEVCEASDFVLIHFNQLPLDQYPDFIADLKTFGKPVMCNEDAKIADEGAAAAGICVKQGVSWGLMVREVNQYLNAAGQLEFNGAADDPTVYATLKQLTTKPLSDARSGS